MNDNIIYWAVSGRSFRSIEDPADIVEGEYLAEGDYPIFPPDYVTDATEERNRLNNEANSITALWRIELALDDISDDDREKLKLWVAYIKALKALDLTAAPNIVWPEPPSA